MAATATSQPGSGPTRPVNEDAAQKSDVAPFDFRTPQKFPVSFIREMGELHKTFAAVMADRLARELRASVTVEPFGVEQLTFEGYVRSIPNPSILTMVALDPIPGEMVVEMSPQLGLTLVDRMLGGPGRPIPPRQPTNLEQTILGALLEHPLAALEETFTGLLEVTPRFVASEFNPQFTHATVPSEMVLVLTFMMVAESTGPATRGLISLCYPLTVVEPIREAIRRARWSRNDAAGNPSEVVAGLLLDAAVDVVVRTSATPVPASHLMGLSPGDVVILEHGADDPLVGHVEGIPLFECDLGSSRGRLAARIRRWK